MTRKVEISWPDFQEQIIFTLSDIDNPEMCQSFWERLPFETIFAASMSAGEMFKVQIPFSLPPVESEKMLLASQLPPGTIVALGNTVLLVKYGIMVEPFKTPILGKVNEEDISTLHRVSIKLRDAYFFSKKIHFAQIKQIVGE